MNTPRPTDPRGDAAACKRTRLWTGSILSAPNPVSATDADAARTMLGFSPTTVIVDQSSTSPNRDEVITETPDTVIADPADTVNADSTDTVIADPADTVIADSADTVNADSTDKVIADSTDTVILPVYRSKTWILIAAGAAGLSLVGLLAFALLRNGGVFSELFPTPAITPTAQALQEPTTVKAQELNIDNQQSKQITQTKPNEQMQQLQHQLAELTKQVTVLNSRANRPRKRSRVASLARKRSKNQGSRVPASIKKKSTDKRARVRVRYDHKQNVVEVWLPKSNADVRVKREGDDRDSAGNDSGKENKQAKGALR